MSTVQSFLPYTNTTVAQYTAWSQGIGTALSTLGWTKVADTGGVTWANIISVAYIPQNSCPLAGTLTFNGAWVAGTSYTGGTQTLSTTQQSAFNVVTNGGLTWACISNTQANGSTGGLVGPLSGSTINQNISVTLTITAVANASGTTTVYTVTGGSATANIYVGMAFTVSGCSNPANNGVFVCTTSNSTTITLANNIGVSTGTFGTAVSSSANFTWFAGGSVANWANNAEQGHTYTFAGFTGGAVGNNGTFVILASHNTINLNNGQAPLVFANASGTTVTASNTTAIEATSPAGNSIASISSTTVTSNVLTVTANNNFLSGQNVVLAGLSTSTFLNGVTVTVLSAGLSSTQFEANFTHANYGATADTGVAVAGDNQHWIVYNYEIWKTAGSNSSTAPIYLKLVYGAANTLQTPAVVLDIGTQNPSTGALSGNHTTEFVQTFSSASGVGNTFECDFSGDADNFAWILWRNATAVNAAIPNVFFIDRTRDTNGNALPTFFNVGAVSSNLGRPFWTLFNQATGGVITFPQQWPFPWVQNPLGLAYQGLTPVLPIFGIPGYVSNPCLMSIAMQINDFTDGQLINAVMYGGSHTFMMSKSNVINNTAIGSTTYAGIRWE